MYISRNENEVMMDIHEKILHNIPYIETNIILDTRAFRKKREFMIEIENQYGKFKYDTDKAITFPNGLLGVEQFNIYGLRKLEGAKLNYMLLQSLEESNVSFLVMPLIINADGITLKDAEQACQELGVKNSDQVVFLGILSMKDKEITVNLKAPIILDCERQLGWQMVMKSTKYSVTHPLFKVSDKIE